jgi:osmotically-inducible protein OsmY
MRTPSGKTDAQIQKDVLRELTWDTRVDQTDVGVEVDRGVVTLTGTVESWGKKLAAQDAAHRVTGVHDVANDIVVRPAGSPGKTDTEIARAVRFALEWDVHVPDEKIASTVASGAVTLTGTVDYATQRDDAARAIQNLEGVRAIVNRIVVDGSVATAAEVRAAIEGALERRAVHAARKVTLEVKDGTVVVSGTVKSWAEREAIIGAATGTPGVSAVEDCLRFA